jgi:hypothetical protein
MGKRKPDDPKLTRLTEAFRKLGAEGAKYLARAQLKEGTPELAQLVFLRQAWTALLDPRDPSWINEVLESGGRTAAALQRLLEKGIDRHDLTTVVRSLQSSVLFQLCYQLDDSGVADAFNRRFQDDWEPVAWALFQVDEYGEPLVPFGNLHELVESEDPYDPDREEEE